MATKSTQQSQNKGNDNGTEQSNQTGFFWKDGMGKFDMAGFYQEAMKYVDGASKLFSVAKIPGLNVDQVIGLQKRGAEAISSTQQIAYDHFLSLGQQQVEMAQKFVEGMNSLTQMVYGGQPLENCISKQIDNTKQVMEHACGSLRHLGTTTQKSMERTIEVVGHYFEQNLNDAKQMLHGVK